MPHNKTKLELTEAERSHLVDLLLMRMEDGGYYGPKNQYYKRTERLLKKLGFNLEENL